MADDLPKGTDDPMPVEFFFDPMCPWAYQTSKWIRVVRKHVPLDVAWRFFSLEEVNREEGKKHPWERDFAFGWTPLRVAAWLRRRDMSLCDAWYEAIGRTLHDEGRRPYERDRAMELLGSIGAPVEGWDKAIADATTHDDVRAEHDRAVGFGGFGVPILVLPFGKPVFGPVVAPAPVDVDGALALWDLVVAYAKVPGLYELKTPKTGDDQREIGQLFSPYLTARQWKTVQNPTP
jgi:2-hydroxychromene-2-carboxylate isomerase